MISAPPDPSVGARLWSDLDAQLRPFVARRVPPDRVDDVVQDTLLRVRRGLPQLREQDRFGPWVYQVARRTILDHFRTARRCRERSMDPGQLSETLEALAPEPPGAEVNPIVAAYATTLIDTLPEVYREAMRLTEVEGLTHSDAAQRLGLSVSGVKSRVQRGRQRLRTALEDCCRIGLDARRQVVTCEPRCQKDWPKGCCG